MHVYFSNIVKPNSVYDFAAVCKVYRKTNNPLVFFTTVKKYHPTVRYCLSFLQYFLNRSIIKMKILTKQAVYYGLHGWENMAAILSSCHDLTMIMTKQSHDNAIVTRWQQCFLTLRHNSWHIHSTITMFPVIHYKIMALSSCFTRFLDG